MLERLRQTKDNLCNYFILPLLSLNRDSFGDGNFINSYVAKDDNFVYVELKNKELAKNYHTHALFECDYGTKNGTMLIYSVLPEQTQDLIRFKHGKYSMITEESKQLISTFSGLEHNKKVSKGFRTDERLLALSKNDSLRKLIELDLGVSIGHTQELMDRPSKACFMKEVVKLHS